LGKRQAIKKKCQRQVTKKKEEDRDPNKKKPILNFISKARNHSEENSWTEKWAEEVKPLWT